MAGYEQKEVASLTNVTLRTLGRWRLSPTFSKLLREGVRKTYDAMIAELVCGAVEAARTLNSIISDPDVPARVKINAIQVLLNNAGRARDYLLEERLENVENLLDAAKNEDMTD